jgi:hypothetical protein
MKTSRTSSMCLLLTTAWFGQYARSVRARSGFCAVPNQSLHDRFPPSVIPVSCRRVGEVKTWTVASPIGRKRLSMSLSCRERCGEYMRFGRHRRLAVAERCHDCMSLRRLQLVPRSVADGREYGRRSH